MIRVYFDRIVHYQTAWELNNIDSGFFADTERGVCSSWYGLPEHGLTPPSAEALFKVAQENNTTIADMLGLPVKVFTGKVQKGEPIHFRK